MEGELLVFCLSPFPSTGCLLPTSSVRTFQLLLNPHQKSPLIPLSGKGAKKAKNRLQHTLSSLIACLPACPPKFQRRLKPWRRQEGEDNKINKQITSSPSMGEDGNCYSRYFCCYSFPERVL